ncbi:UDP-N-acetylglucosamine 2-epimerase [Aliikangiella sp. G2MR2-5]|uniref:UDP-N-acetylglucosamine 2-epimerase n=1 Tax=Aliikangiella sp. G2MR2-5 TaxID=2788943 RepID=UPI0018AA0C9A|nr:UDP-N-acetylglucosamine 2-epimerase [Aliikangiella sp. G2MR2-5]
MNSNNKLKVVAVSTSRADFSHLYWPLRLLEAESSIELTVLAMAAHLSPEYGNTWSEIENAGFKRIEKLECLVSSDSDVGMAKSLGLATLGLADQLDNLRPDLLLLIADRYEMLAPASVALTLRIPIAHIEGGDISEGAIDDAVRNALTKMSHLHFTPTESARQRVLKMGEESWRVYFSGAPSLDHLRRSSIPDEKLVREKLSLTETDKIIIVAYHPVTLLDHTTAEMESLFEALEKRNEQIVFCFPNADTGSHQIMEKAEKFSARHPKAQIRVNLDPITYFGLLCCANMMVGNSSSGIMESPSMGLPAVNIGLRQQGREQAKNIIDVSADATAISIAIEKALCPAFKESIKNTINPYGDGHAAERILEVLKRLPSKEKLLFKKSTI